MRRVADIEGLSYGLLALGDRTYANFVGFGRDLGAGRLTALTEAGRYRRDVY